jgi:hypothetical protein
MSGSMPRASEASSSMSISGAYKRLQLGLDPATSGGDDHVIPETARYLPRTFRHHSVPAKQEDHLWREIASVVVGAFSGAAWVSTVGSGIVGIRLSNASLPSESVVALMSAEHRFVIGAGYLIVPLLAGVIVLLVDRVLIQADHLDPWRAIAALVLTILGYGAAFYLMKERHGELVVQCIATLLILGAIVALSGHSFLMVHQAVIAFLATLVIVGTIALAFEKRRPPVFEHITITLKDSPSSATSAKDEGPNLESLYYVTTTESSIVTISLTHCQRIVVVPRDNVTRIEVGPTRVRVLPSNDCRSAREAMDQRPRP